MNEIKQRCLCLSNTERMGLISWLKKSLEEELVDDGSRFYQLYSVANDIVGGGILTMSKLPDAVLGRKMIAYQMRQEGYTLKSIGHYIHRSHSEAHHLITSMKDMLDYPHAFRSEVKKWNDFQARIKDEVRSEMV